MFIFVPQSLFIILYLSYSNLILFFETLNGIVYYAIRKIFLIFNLFTSFISLIFRSLKKIGALYNWNLVDCLEYVLYCRKEILGGIDPKSKHKIIYIRGVFGVILCETFM